MKRSIRVETAPSMTKESRINILQDLERLVAFSDEGKNRIAIQNYLDEHNIKETVLYDGNSVYPSTGLLKEFQRMRDSGSIQKLTKNAYHFLIYGVGDIAHYDKEGFIDYYDGSYIRLFNELLAPRASRIPTRYADVVYILQTILKRGVQ